MTSVDHLPNDAESLKRLLLAREEELVAAREAQAAAEAEAARALAQVSSAEAMIAHYKLAIEKHRRALYGQRSERGERLLGQMELQLEELEATATEDALAAETADGTTVRSFTRRKTGRKPFPEHLPRERIVVPGPTACACCGGPAGQDRRGRHRDAGGRAPAVEGDPDGAREVHLPGLREHRPAAGAVPRRGPRLGRPQPAGDDPV
jgi:hypothetical protein